MIEAQLEEDAKSSFLQAVCRGLALPSPCFVLDECRLKDNAAILEEVEKRGGARILLALKGFAAWSMFPLLSRTQDGPLFGVCASSVDEARLGRENFGGEVHAFAAAWSDSEMRELLQYVDHLTFNSIGQWEHFKGEIERHNQKDRPHNPILCGLRINPEHSEGAPDIYNPCSPKSRLGIRAAAMPPAGNPVWEKLSGLHFHTLCEQDSEAFARTLQAFERKFSPWLDQASWFNFGGGHHITRKDYDIDSLIGLLTSWRQRHPGTIYLEPGEAVALNAGWLVARVLDVVEADMPVAILDCSAACHMPDVLEMPYRPEAWSCGDCRPTHAGLPGEKAFTCRLAGKSCLAGDNIGEYSFAKMLTPGDMIIFSDMAIYSMVKTTTFNGLRLPGIGAWNGLDFRLLRSFAYDDFKNRLS